MTTHNFCYAGPIRAFIWVHLKTNVHKVNITLQPGVVEWIGEPRAPVPSDALEQVLVQEQKVHCPSIAFRHLPPNSARTGYATDRATLYLRAAVHRRGQRPPKGLCTN